MFDKINKRFDPYLIRYITEYLKLCNHCDKYDIYNYQQSCCFCKIFYCSYCKDKLKRNYNHYETISNYCEICNVKCFEYKLPPKPNYVFPNDSSTR